MTDRQDAPVLTTSDRTLLERPLYAVLTIPPATGRLPAPRPVWFEATADGDLQLFSLAGARRLRRLEADPRASFVVVRPPGEEEGWLSVEADVTVHDDGAKELADRLTDRYWDATHADRRASAKAMWAAEELRRIVLHPRRIARGPA